MEGGFPGRMACEEESAYSFPDSPKGRLCSAQYNACHYFIKQKVSIRSIRSWPHPVIAEQKTHLWLLFWRLFFLPSLFKSNKPVVKVFSFVYDLMWSDVITNRPVRMSMTPCPPAEIPRRSAKALALGSDARTSTCSFTRSYTGAQVWPLSGRRHPYATVRNLPIAAE